MALGYEVLSKQPYFKQNNLPGYVYLNRSNYITWDNDVISALIGSLTSSEITQYPANALEAFKNKVRAVFNIDESLAITIGNGCIDLLNLLFQSQCIPCKTVITTSPNLFLYQHLCHVYQCKQITIPLLNDFSLPVKALIEAAEEEHEPVILLSYPNCQTGHCYSRQDIETLLTKTNATVVIDETFQAYANKSLVDLIDKHSQLIVIRSFSKMGMAGLRLGYLVSRADFAKRIDATYLPFQTNTASLLIALSLLENGEELFNQIDEVIFYRDQLLAHLNDIPGITAYESEADFINFSYYQLSSQELFQMLYAKKIVTHPIHYPPHIEHCVRVTIGENWQHETLLRALSD